MIVFLSARQLALYRSPTAASNSSLVAMLTRLIPPSARLPLWEQLRRGNGHDSGAVLARQCGRSAKLPQKSPARAPKVRAGFIARSVVALDVVLADDRAPDARLFARERAQFFRAGE